MQSILEKFGPWGYGILMLVTERIVQQMDNSGRTDASYSLKNWARYCRTYGKNLKVILDFIRISQASRKNDSGISIEDDGNFIRIDMPGLATRLDEWTQRKWKNSGETPEQLGRNSRATPERIEQNKRKKEFNKKERPYYPHPIEELIE